MYRAMHSFVRKHQQYALVGGKGVGHWTSFRVGRGRNRFLFHRGWRAAAVQRAWQTDGCTSQTMVRRQAGRDCATVRTRRMAEADEGKQFQSAAKLSALGRGLKSCPQCPRRGADQGSENALCRRICVAVNARLALAGSSIMARCFGSLFGYRFKFRSSPSSCSFHVRN